MANLDAPDLSIGATRSSNRALAAIGYSPTPPLPRLPIDPIYKYNHRSEPIAALQQFHLMKGKDLTAHAIDYNTMWTILSKRFKVGRKISLNEI